jgi:phage shock protein E
MARPRHAWLTLVLLAGCLKGTITGPAARALVASGQAVLVDVRTPLEYRMGHLEGAVSVPLGELDSRLATFPAARDQDVILYCRSGHRSAAAAKVLTAAGFTRVHDLGSLVNWEQE